MLKYLSLPWQGFTEQSDGGRCQRIVDSVFVRARARTCVCVCVCVSKFLAKRMKEVLNEIIHHDQVGYIKDRNIGEAVRLIDDMLFYSMH